MFGHITNMVGGGCSSVEVVQVRALRLNPFRDERTREYMIHLDSFVVFFTVNNIRMFEGNQGANTYLRASYACF